MSAAPKLEAKKVKGGEIISAMLAAEGVEKVFGIIDGSYFGFYSTLGKHGVDIVTPRHETSALHMAGAYSRLTGKLGVCMASNGPGVANALPGVAVENAEGNRVLLVTSSRRNPITGPDRGGTFQCFPQCEAIAAMAKWSCTVPSMDRVAEISRMALRQCFTGRPGLVHLDVPEDLMNGAVAPNPAWMRAPEQYRPTAALEPSAAQIDEVAELLRSAQRPLIHAGSGVIWARAFRDMMALAEAQHIPITTSWAARAVVDERHPLSLPMPYLEALERARNQADLVLVLGSRLGETDWWGKPPYWAPAGKQLLVQVDVDPDCLGRIRPVDVAVQADVGAFLRALGGALTGVPAPSGRAPWVESLQALARKRRAQLDDKLDDRSPMHPAVVARTCMEVFDDDAILVVDGGNTAVWTHFYHQVRSPGAVVTTFKMGMLGAGVSQVLGAKAACPGKQAYCILGDGAMGFHPQEVETAVRNNLQVVWIVLCDRQWGMVKMNQQFALKPLKTLIKKRLSEDETIKTDLSEIEFDVLARSMGAHGERVSDPAGLEGALRRSLASGLPAVVHVDVDPVAHLWAPNLKEFKDMHNEPRG